MIGGWKHCEISFAPWNHCKLKKKPKKQRKATTPKLRIVVITLCVMGIFIFYFKKGIGTFCLKGYYSPKHTKCLKCAGYSAHAVWLHVSCRGGLMSLGCLVFICTC